MTESYDREETSSQSTAEEEPDLDNVLKHYIRKQVKKTMAKPSRKEQSQRRKMEATICTQTDNAIDAPSEDHRSDKIVHHPSENHRSDKIVHHHNIEGLQGIYLEQPEVDGYTSDDFNELHIISIGRQ